MQTLTLEASSNHWTYGDILDFLEGYCPSRKSKITLQDNGWWLVTFE